MIRGIDISHWQGDIDFNKVKNAEIEFCIIKAGGSDAGFYTDKMYETNYTKAKAAGLKVGAYYFVGKNFRGTENGLADAKRFLAQLTGKQFEYPVFLDLETTEPRYKSEVTEASIAFMEYLEDNGYFVGIYASDISGFKDRLDESLLAAYTHWVASYTYEPRYIKNYGIWQYSSKGSVKGIVGSVDLDMSTTDYSKTIIRKGFNGFKKTTKTKTEVKDV